MNGEELFQKLSEMTPEQRQLPLGYEIFTQDGKSWRGRLYAVDFRGPLFLGDSESIVVSNE